MATESNDTLDALTPQQLVSEIKQISLQYSAEVPGTRRSWPESIRARILALGRLGVPRRKISELTGIPAATVFVWCRALSSNGRKRRAGHFIALEHRPGRSDQPSATPTVRANAISPTAGQINSKPLAQGHRTGLGLVLRAPQGIAIEGFTSVEELVQLYRELIR